MDLSTGEPNQVDEDGWALPRPMSCFNCQELLVGRPKSKNRGPDTAWVGQCGRCTELLAGQMEVIQDRPDGQFIQVLRCTWCGSARACRPGWSTRCHVCHDQRTAPMWLADSQRLYTEHVAKLNDEATVELEEQLREFALIGDQAPSAHDIADFVADQIQVDEMDRRARTGWTLLATDLGGMPWSVHQRWPSSHGTWAVHDRCGRVQRLIPGRGRTECGVCPPDAESRTHRARRDDDHLLYLVRFNELIKFGHGDEARVRAHLRGGAEVIQVIQSTHGKVVQAERVLKKRYAKVARRRRRRMPSTFGAGTEVLPGSMAFDLGEVLGGTDVSFRFR